MGIYINVEENVRIYLEDLNPAGKETIVFLHGWPGNHNFFEYQFDVFPGLGYRCVGLDCRGFGKSDRPWTGYDYDRLADDVYRVITGLGLRNVTLLGHSTGGAIAVRYMARHRGFGVSKLVLCAAAAPSLIRRPDFPFGLQRETVLEIIEGVRRDRPQTLRAFGEMIFYRPVSAALSDWIFDLGLMAAGWSTSAIANAWLKEELFDDLTRIVIPTLILQGREDQVVLYPLAVYQEQHIRDAKLVTLEDCGHFLFYEQRLAFNAALQDFLET